MKLAASSLSTRLRQGQMRRCVAALLASVVVIGAANADASRGNVDPDEIRRVYDRALALFGDLELESALTLVDDTIASAQGDSSTPALVSMYLLRAALLYSSRGDDAREDIEAALTRAVEINYFADFPGQLNSDGLRTYLQRARDAHGPGPGTAIIDRTQGPECDAPVYFSFMADVPEGGRLVVYWRARDKGEYYPRPIELFAASAADQLEPDSHRNANIDYYVVILDASDRIVASNGEPAAPIRLDNPCAPQESTAVEPETKPKDEPKPIGSFGRAQLGILIGTGLGVAHGRADHTLQQYDPQNSGFRYGAREAACASARWAGQGNGLPPESQLWGDDREQPSESSVFGTHAGSPTVAALWAMAYEEGACSEHHAVVSGLASAPLQIAPSFLYRVTSRFSVGLQARLQVYTGSNLSKPSSDQSSTPLSGNPKGTKISDGIPWALSVEGRYEWLKEGSKWVPYIGGYLGYGKAKLRVDMGFGADNNGNSVPDNREVACDGDFAVFPFSEGCEDGGDPGQALAKSVRDNASSANVVDTVTIGSLMAGLSLGTQYLFTPHVGLAGEARVGVWLPKTTSLLIDLQVGPVFRF